MIEPYSLAVKRQRVESIVSFFVYGKSDLIVGAVYFKFDLVSLAGVMVKVPNGSAVVGFVVALCLSRSSVRRLILQSNAAARTNLEKVKTCSTKSLQRTLYPLRICPIVR